MDSSGREKREDKCDCELHHASVPSPNGNRFSLKGGCRTPCARPPGRPSARSARLAVDTLTGQDAHERSLEPEHCGLPDHHRVRGGQQIEKRMAGKVRFLLTQRSTARMAKPLVSGAQL
jgi:hypothetical protein